MLSVGDFLGAVSRSCARGRAGSVTRWCLKSRRVGTLVLCIEETSLSITQPHTAYLSLRCGRSSHDERVQVFRIRLQGNTNECSGRSSQYIYIYIYIHSVRSAQSRDVSGSVDCKGEIKTSRHAKTGSWQ